MRSPLRGAELNHPTHAYETRAAPTWLVGGGMVTLVLAVAAVGAGLVVRALRTDRVADDRRHYEAVIEMMAADVVAEDGRHAAAVERARLDGTAEAIVAAESERALLVDRHRIELAEAVRRAEARGYVAGVRRRLAEARSRPRQLRLGDKPN